MQALARYLIELQHPAGGWQHLPGLAARIRKAAELMRDEGRSVRFLRSVFVPEDDACFFLVEASSARVARQLLRRAQATDLLRSPGKPVRR